MKLAWQLPKTTLTIVPARQWTLGNSRRGYFKHNGEIAERDGVITVTFRPAMHIKGGLGAKEQQKVISHEQRHDADFRKLAAALKKAIEKKIAKNQDPQSTKRWDWFEYDVCEAANRFHREQMKKGMDADSQWIEFCEEPSGHRPQ